MNNRIQMLTKKLNIQYPIFQAGMVWTSGAKLAAAASNAGILGVIGAGSMNPDLLDQQIKKAQLLTKGTLAVNLPLLYSGIEEQIQVCLQNGINVFITSAGSPKIWTSFLKEKNCTVIHVISTPALAKKCEDAGVDMVVAEGFEAGGHNGRDEITTMTLIPQVVDAVKIPVIAAGGIIDARGIAAAVALGASAVQMGTRFLMTQESSAHPHLKNLYLKATPESTSLSLKKHVPVRLYKNGFYQKVRLLEDRGASAEELIDLLGKGRAKRGILEGDLNEGELEIGQGVSLIKDLPTVQDCVQKLISDYRALTLSFPAF